MPRPVITEARFELPFPREEVWGVFSKTDWLNRAAGLPPVDYRITPLPQGGTQVMASAKFAGIRFEWEERPFEWVEPEFYQVERFFARGPLERIFGGAEFLRKSANETTLRIFSEFYPRNAVGSVVAKFALARLATAGMAGIVRHVTSFLQGKEKAALPNLERKPLNDGAFSAAMGRLDPGAATGRLLPKFETFLRESPDVELARLRPLAVARKWNEDPWLVLHLFLQATRAGLLDLSWEVLCPNCRSSRQPLTRSLAELSGLMHCEACQIKYDAQFDQSVELKFALNPHIKKCDERTWCLAGPGGKSHVIAQWIVPAKGSRELKWTANGEALQLKSPQVNDVLEGNALNSGGHMVCERDRFVFESNEAAAIHACNPNAYPVVIALERRAWDDDVLTAARVTNLQEFRDLFAREVVSPTEQITIGQQIILFTDLRGSTAMYRGIGDAPAYALVRDHFHLLHEVMTHHHGCIVKTIGDAVMGSFSDPAEALAAVQEMHARMAALPGRAANEPLKLKSSLHLGPCLAVNANDRLDYFGTTVNLAARLVDCCQGGDLTVSEDFYRRPETQEFVSGHEVRREPLEMKFRGFEGPTRVWRLQLAT